MKRIALSLALILLMLVAVSTLANSLQASAASYPSEPVTDPPEIIVYSPSNTTYYENNILVNFTVNQPDSWHQDNLTLVKITQVSYQLDDPIPGHIGFMNSTNNQFSAMLKEVPDGKHSLRIDVLTNSIYKPQRENWIFTETYTFNTRLIVNFTVEAGPSPSASPSPSLSPSPSPKPSESVPTIWVVVAIAGSVAVIYAGIIIYCEKRKRQRVGLLGNKRTFIAVAILSLFAASLLVEEQVKVAKAAEPPVIQTPQNKIYATNTISVTINAYDPSRALVNLAYQLDGGAEVIVYAYPRDP